MNESHMYATAQKTPAPLLMGMTHEGAIVVTETELLGRVLARIVRMTRAEHTRSAGNPAPSAPHTTALALTTAVLAPVVQPEFDFAGALDQFTHQLQCYLAQTVVNAPPVTMRQAGIWPALDPVLERVLFLWICDLVWQALDHGCAQIDITLLAQRAHYAICVAVESPWTATPTFVLDRTPSLDRHGVQVVATPGVPLGQHPARGDVLAIIPATALIVPGRTAWHQERKR